MISSIDQSLHDAFVNYQSDKLNIDNPDLTNLQLIVLYRLLAWLTSRKYDSTDSRVLDRLQTEQLKGLAIFLVVVGHL